MLKPLLKRFPSRLLRHSLKRELILLQRIIHGRKITRELSNHFFQRRRLQCLYRGRLSELFRLCDHPRYILQRVILERMKYDSKVAINDRILNHNDQRTRKEQKEIPLTIRAFLVPEERVPEPEDVGKGELLGEKEGQPAEGVEPGVEILCVEAQEDVLVDRREECLVPADGVVRVQHPVVHLLDEAAGDLVHEVGEAEEGVGLDVLERVAGGVGGEDVVDGR